jgi:hypothetical protein
VGIEIPLYNIITYEVFDLLAGGRCVSCGWVSIPSQNKQISRHSVEE